ncbi:hypothetical protein DPMN_072132 [Dreissena polymorpha]|uniref:Uncharacterized protein n=1 Tax=Dreissena polymorpha TaxID=45954 RepID=A0A9D3Z5Z1_DREPO|nr:hypothetical protein DPMN_072132 [Dreissena polymorpha]
MGINIVLWRARIGCFSQPKKTVYRIKALVIPKGVKCRFLTSFRLATCIAAIILTCGDVESNPGPPKEVGTRRKTQHSGQDDSLGPIDRLIPNRPVTRAQAPSGATPEIDSRTPNNNRTTFDPKQRRISTYATPITSHPISQERIQEPNTIARDENRSVNNIEILTMLSAIRNDMNKQHHKVSTEFTNIDSKMDKLMSTISDLKSDNERLKQNNIDLKQQVTDMQQKLDITDNQSRRNNL